MNNNVSKMENKVDKKDNKLLRILFCSFLTLGGAYGGIRIENYFNKPKYFYFSDLNNDKRMDLIIQTKCGNGYGFLMQPDSTYISVDDAMKAKEKKSQLSLIAEEKDLLTNIAAERNSLKHKIKELKIKEFK